MNPVPDQRQPIQVWRVNAFTTRPFTGNPAGVVPDADALSEPLMQSIAAELNDISETVFILRRRSKLISAAMRRYPRCLRCLGWSV
jgi:PhzF family phenazine biosynthesis protein